MSPLQKWPIGLLSVFDLKTLGKAPTGFVDTVQPVVDVLDWYAREQQQVTREVLNTGSLTSSAQIIATVPAGEVWLVYAAEGNAFLNAADVAEDTQMSMRVRFQGGNALMLAEEITDGSVMSLQSRFVLTGELPRPLILRQSDALVFTANNIGGTFAGDVAMILQTLKSILPA